MSSDKIKIGIVGFGYWGPNLARNFAASDFYDLAWIADISEKGRTAAQKFYPLAKTTDRYKDILDDASVELVAIATPTKTHHQIAKDALFAEKHVLVEKPMASSSAEAEELVKISRNKKLVLAVDHPFLYSAPVRKLKEVIDSGELGDIFFADSERINLGLIQKDVNVFWDLAVHDLYIMDYLFGGKLPISLVAEAESYTQMEQHEFGTVSLRYPERRIVNITASWLSPVKTRRMMIVGSKKMAHYDDVNPDEKLKIIDKGVEYSREADKALSPIYRWGDAVLPRLANKEPLALEIEELYGAIREGKKIPSLGEDGARIIKTLEAVNESLKFRREVKLC